MDYRSYARDYHTANARPGAFPSLRFYAAMAGILYRAGKLANAGAYTGQDWANSSAEVGMAMERVGASIHIEGFANVTDTAGPCVFVANHMSTLETFFLPCIIQPVKDATFVVKGALLKYPCLGPVLQSRDPIVVGRVNPREDLATVLEEGQKHLAAGRSVIIFPQGTRSPMVDEEHFSSLGSKLAKRADVPVIPVALKTDAWGTGALLKDIGWIRPQKPIHIRFGAPVRMEGNGKAGQAQVFAFIRDTFEGWNARS